MYCTNCGKQIDPNAILCVHCGVRCGQVNAYCGNCGGATVPGATICMKCGAPIYTNGKSRIAAGLFGIFLGCFGVHNYYLGYNGKATVQLLITVLTCGIGAAVSSIWGLIEGILLLTDSGATDAKGIPLKD